MEHSTNWGLDQDEEDWNLDWHEGDLQTAVAAEEEEVSTSIGRTWAAIDKQKNMRVL